MTKTQKLRNSIFLNLLPLIIFAVLSNYLVYDYKRSAISFLDTSTFIDQVEYPYLIVGIVSYILVIGFYWIYSYKIESINKDLVLKAYNLFIIIFSIKMMYELISYVTYIKLVHPFMITMLVFINAANIINLIMMYFYKKDKKLDWNKKETIFLFLIVFYDLFSYLTYRVPILATEYYDATLDAESYMIMFYTLHLAILLTLLIILIYIFASKKFSLNYKIVFNSILLSILAFNYHYVVVATGGGDTGKLYSDLWTYFFLMFIPEFSLYFTLIPISLLIVNIVFLGICEARKNMELKRLDLDNNNVTTYE